MKHEIIKFCPLQVCYVMIHVIKHDMDPNIDLNYSRKIGPIKCHKNMWLSKRTGISFEPCESEYQPATDKIIGQTFNT